MAAMRNKRQEILRQMREAKEGKVRRSEQYTVEEEDDAFKYLTEKEYQKEVLANRQQSFIVDDFGYGYDDQGEFEWKEEQELEDKKPKLNSSIKKFMKPGRTKIQKQQETPVLNIEADEFLNMLEDDSIKIEDLRIQEKKAENKIIQKKTVSSRIEAANSSFQAKYNKPAPRSIPIIQQKEPPINRKRKSPGDSAPVEKEQVKEEIEEEPVEEVPVEYFEDTNMEIDVPIEVEALETKMELDTDIVVEDFKELEKYEILDPKNSPLPFDENGNLKIYWYDAFEDKSISNKEIFIFGKIWYPNTSRYESICLAVQNIMRKFYVLPKEEFRSEEEIMKVFEELETQRRKLGISSWKCKKVKRRYAFEVPGIPSEALYLKFQYNSEYREITKITGKTISHVFGLNTSLEETLLVKTKMMGPGWLLIKNAKHSSIKRSHCRLEIIVESPNLISPILENVGPPPLLTGLSLSVKFIRNTENVNEVFSISGVIDQNIDQVASTSNRKKTAFSLIRNIPGYPSVQNSSAISFDEEKLLIINFLAKIIRIDPDIIMAHELYSTVLEVLIKRIIDLKVNNWSRLGRLIRSVIPKSGSINWLIRLISAGRLLCDTFLNSQELVREANYSLDHLVSSLLKKNFTKIEDVEFELHEEGGAKKICFQSEAEAAYVMEICNYLNIIPLTKQLTNIAGNLWVRSLNNARAERNEMLLIHTFTNYKFICPDKHIPDTFKEKSKNKNQYAGGLVLEPKAGLYDSIVLLLDFNSLYPSIIQEYNLCFTTVHRNKEDREDNTPGTPPDANVNSGILPLIIKQLVDSRRQIKNQMEGERNSDNLKRLEIKQQALKLTANSIYGCLGFRQNRFYARPIASLITLLGRKALETAVSIARDTHRLEVIYGDTDSIMILTNTRQVEQARNIGFILKKDINKHFKRLEIEIDGIFKSMLLLRKKKYAVIKYVSDIETEREVKGIDMVRRDWCQLSKSASEEVLNLILSENSMEDITESIKEFLSSLKAKIDQNEIELSEFIITKQLTRPPEKYADIKALPHVKVAQQLMNQGYSNLIKHFIPYVIVKAEGSLSDKARHPDEVMNSAGALEIDTDWYISQEIFPPISRLCQPIDSIDTGEVAEKLGLDPAKFEFKEIESVQVATVNKEIEELFVKCSCGEDVEITSETEENNYECVCGLIVALSKIQNVLSIKIRKMSFQMQKSRFICEDRTCETSTRAFLKICPVIHCKGRMIPEYSIREFHVQLEYFKKKFERFEFVSKTLKKSVYQKISIDRMRTKFDKFKFMI